jgi:hypothetical protein
VELSPQLVGGAVSVSLGRAEEGRLDHGIEVDPVERPVVVEEGDVLRGGGRRAFVDRGGLHERRACSSTPGLT